MIDFVNTTTYKIKCTTFDEFKNTLISSNKQYFGITNYLNNLHNENSIIIKSDITDTYLSKNHLSWPKIDTNYMNKIINYIRTNKLIGGNTNEN